MFHRVSSGAKPGVVAVVEMDEFSGDVHLSPVRNLPVYALRYERR